MRKAVRYPRMPIRSRAADGKAPMLIQILAGFLISMICIMIHAMATIAAIGVARVVGLRHTEWPRVHLMAVMVATVVVLEVAHGLEVVVWALAYALLGAAPEGTELLY